MLAATHGQAGAAAAEGVFAGVLFWLDPELASEDRVRLRRVIERHGGAVIEQERASHRVVHVFNKFGGARYKGIHSGGFPIVGPPCVTMSADMGLPLPDTRSRVAVYSRRLEGMCLCPTGLADGLRFRLQTLVVCMNGRFEQNFSKSVTHLVARGVGGPKYRAAVARGIPVIQQQFVLDCWQSDTLCDVRKYALPALMGLRVCITGLNMKERDDIKALCEANGAAFEPDLTLTCTHLLAAEPKGVKFTLALKHSITVVSPRWLYDSIAAGVSLDERPFMLVRPSQTEGDAQGNESPICVDSVMGVNDSSSVDEQNSALSSSRVSAPFAKRPVGQAAAAGGAAVAARAAAGASYAVYEAGADPVNADSRHVVAEDTPRRIRDPDAIVPRAAPPIIRPAAAVAAAAAVAVASAVRGVSAVQSLTRPAGGDDTSLSKRVAVDSSAAVSAAAGVVGAAGVLTLHRVGENVGPNRAVSRPSTCFVGGLLGEPLAKRAAALCAKAHLQVVSREADASYTVLVWRAPSSRPIASLSSALPVSIDWLESCADAVAMGSATVPDPASHPIYQPLGFDPEQSVLIGKQVCVSQYVDDERNRLLCLIRLLGGTPSERFNKQTEMLVCAYADGRKYERAVELGVPVTTQEALFDYARGKPLRAVAPPPASHAPAPTGLAGADSTGGTGAAASDEKPPVGYSAPPGAASAAAYTVVRSSGVAGVAASTPRSAQAGASAGAPSSAAVDPAEGSDGVLIGGDVHEPTYGRASTIPPTVASGSVALTLACAGDSSARAPVASATDLLARVDSTNSIAAVQSPSSLDSSIASSLSLLRQKIRGVTGEQRRRGLSGRTATGAAAAVHGSRGTTPSLRRTPTVGDLAGTPSVSVVAPSLDELSSSTRGALAVFASAADRPRVILLSGFSNAERDALRSFVVALPNATMLDTAQYNNSCTHLILKKPNHCEKFLAACAARVWVLKSEYLQDSATARSWLPEAAYEWTSADASTPTDREMYGAPIVCRMRSSDVGAAADGAKCFSGVVCVFEKDLPKREAFMRVVLAGGATVADELADVADGACCVHVCCKDSVASTKRNVTVVDVDGLVGWLVSHAGVKSKLKEVARERA